MSMEWLAVLKSLDYTTTTAVKRQTNRLGSHVQMPGRLLVELVEMVCLRIPIFCMFGYGIYAGTRQESVLEFVVDSMWIVPIITVGYFLWFLIASGLQLAHYWLEYEEARKTPRWLGMGYIAWGYLLAAVAMLATALVVEPGILEIIAIAMVMVNLSGSWLQFCTRDLGDRPKRRKRRAAKKQLTVLERLGRVVPQSA